MAHYKTALTTTFVLAALAVQAQNVTVTALGERLETFVPKLAAAAGTNLAVDASARNEVIFVSVKDVPLEDLKARIAAATGLAWIDVAGGSRLAPTDATNRTARQEYATWTTEWLNASRGKDELVLRAQENFQVDGQANPNGKFIGREATNALGLILRDLDMSALGNIDVGGRIVFSTNRTLTQVPFPQSALRWAMKAGTDTMQAWRAQLASVGTTRGSDARAQVLNQRLQNGVKKVILAVRRQSQDYFTFSLNVLDPSGNVVASAGTALIRLPNKVQEGLPAVAPFDHPAPKYLDTVRGATASSPSANGAVEEKPLYGMKAAADQLQDCLKDDPLAVVAGPWFAKLAEGRSIVAVLPDQSLARIAFALRSKANAWPAVTADCVVQVIGGSVDISPASHLAAWKSRVDRSSFSSLMSGLNQSYGMLGLEALAQYIGSQPAWTEARGWDVTCLQVVWGGQVSKQLQVGHGASRDALRVFGSCSRKLAGQPALQDKASAFLDKGSLGYILFNRDQGPMHVDSQARQPQTNSLTLSGNRVEGRTITYEISGLGQSAPPAMPPGPSGMIMMSAERTEMLPNGLQGEGKIEASLNRNQTMLLVDGMTGEVMTMSPSQYAMILAQAHYPSGGKQIDPARFTQFGLAEQESFGYRYWPEQDTMMNGNIFGFNLVTKPGPYDQLPKQLQIQVAAMQKQYMQQLSQQTGNTTDSRTRTGTKVPPPA